MKSSQEVIPALAELEELPSPAVARPECTRDSLLKAPDWRWQEAQAFVRDKRNSVPCTPSSDPLVQYAIRIIAAQDMQGTSRATASLWPCAYEAMALGQSSSALASELDAYLIKGFDHSMAAMAGCPVSRDVYNLYAGLFMDLTGIRAIHSWMHDSLFAPAIRDSEHSTLRVRLIAYYGGGLSGVHSAVSGMLSGKDSDVMRVLMANERQKKLFDYVVRITKMPPELYAQLMEGALKDMSDKEFQERMRTLVTESDESLEALAHDMELGIRAYSQSELDTADTTGIDFSNRYTKDLVRRN